MNGMRRFALVWVSVLIAVISFAYVWKQGLLERPEEPSVSSSELDRLIDALEKEQSFSGVVLIAQGDRVLFSRASGLADRVSGQPMTLDTAFATSSMGKMFTSMLVHRYSHAGKLDLDATVERYLPGSGLPAANQVTLRQLLSHTSGYGNHFSHPLYEQSLSRGGATRSELMQMIRETPLVSDPGQKWRYSNAGYVVLGWVVEEVTGKPFQEALELELLGPMAISLSKNQIPRAAGHRAVTAAVFSRATAPTDPAVTGMGDGGWMLTAQDLHRFAVALHRNQIPGVDDWQGFLNSTHELRDDDGFETRYGEGLMTTSFRGLTFVGHDGASDGWSTDLRVNHEDGMTFIVLSNNSEVVSLDVVNRLIRSVYGLRFEMPVAQRKAILIDLVASTPLDILVTELNSKLQSSGFESVNDPMVLIDVAETLQRASFDELALKTHRLNLALFSDRSPAHGAYGEYLYWVEKSPEKALLHFEAMLKKFPEDGYASQRIEEIRKELAAKH